MTNLDRPVVSIGNLSVGGTGKTPMAARAVHVLRGAGATPCIAMRGYKAVSGLSDEAAELRELCGVPIVAQADRLAGLRELFVSTPEIDAVVLDDGFQHRRIARDVDIVCIDASRPGERLLPAGRLREPFASLARAHAVVITHAEYAQREDIDNLRRRITDAHADILVCEARHAWTHVEDASGGHQPVSALKDASVLVVCAIAHPEAFVAQARAACKEVVDTVQLRDHAPYTARTASRIARRASGADAILTTGKDWAKLSRIDPALWPCPVLHPRLDLAFDSGWNALEELLTNAIRRWRREHGHMMEPITHGIALG